MGFVGYTHTDKKVLNWAEYYTAHTITLIEMEAKYNISHSTIWWCFQNRLPLLDVKLYDKVLETLEYNKRNKPIHKRANRR